MLVPISQNQEHLVPKEEAEFDVTWFIGALPTFFFLAGNLATLLHLAHCFVASRSHLLLISASGWFQIFIYVQLFLCFLLKILFKSSFKIEILDSERGFKRAFNGSFEELHRQSEVSSAKSLSLKIHVASLKFQKLQSEKGGVGNDWCDMSVKYWCHLVH